MREVAGERFDELELHVMSFAVVVTDDLRAYRDRWGISYYSVMADTMEAFAPVVAELSGN